MVICSEVPLRATQAVIAELFVCLFHLKLYENILMFQSRPPSVRPIGGGVGWAKNIPNNMRDVTKKAPPGERIEYIISG